MNISKVALSIYNVVVNNEILYIEKILKIIKINERKLRYEIYSLDFFLRKNKLGSIFIKNGNVYFNILEDKDSIYKKLNNSLKLTKDERIIYIKLNLMLNEKISLNRLSEKLGVSKITVKKDLKTLSSTLNKNIKIVLDRQYSLVGDEISIREECIEILNNNPNLLNMYHLDEIDIFLDKILEQDTNILIRNRIYLYILIILKRKNKLKSEKNIDNIKIYKEIINHIDIISNSLNNTEIIHLSNFINSTITNKLSIEEKKLELEILVRNLINNVSEKLNLIVNNNDELIKGLVVHIMQAIDRIRNNIYLDEITYNYDEDVANNIINILKEELKYIENIFKISFSKSEIILLSVYFMTFIEKNPTKNTSKILLMCIGGAGTTEILVNKLKDRYDISKIKIISLKELDNKIIKDYELLITTFKFNSKLNIPTIQISPLLTKKEKEILDKYLKKKNNNKNIVNYETSIKNKYFSLNNLFFIDYKLYSWKEVISFGVNKMTELSYVDSDYEKSIIDNIENYGSYMIVSPLIAIPHSTAKKSYKTSGIIVGLKYPIKFPNNKDVKLLFFISQNKDNKNNEIIYEILSLISKIEDIKKIYDISSLREELFNVTV